MTRLRPAAETPWLLDMGRALKEARTRRGLTLRECAALLGLGRQTIFAAERGVDCQASTLARYLERLPGLTPARLLGMDVTNVPAASGSAWETHRDLCGYSARSVLVRVQALGDGRFVRLVVVHGLAAVHAPMTDSAIRAALCRLACDAPKGQLDDVGLGEPGTTGHVVVDNVVHGWRIPRLPDDGLTFWSRRVVGEATEPSWPSTIPVETLCLALGGVDAIQGGRIGCWPLSTPTEPRTDASAWLYPRGVRVERQGRALVARIDRPAPLVNHQLLPGAANAQEVEAVRPGARIHRARRSAGIGLAAAATEVDCARNTLRRLERGSDARASILRSVALRFDIPAEHLLPPGQVVGALDLHDWQRRLYGLEATGISKTVTVSGDGVAEIRIHTHGLRSLRAPAGDLRLQIGLARAALQLKPDLLHEIETDAQELKVRVVKRFRQGTLHELSLPRRAVGESGINYTRRLEPSRQFAMTRAQALEMFGEDEACEFGSSLAVVHPVRELRLTMRFPRGFEPANLGPHAWTNEMVPDFVAASLLRLPPMKVAVAKTDRHLVATLTVRRPLVGFKYGIGWKLLH